MKVPEIEESITKELVEVSYNEMQFSFPYEIHVAIGNVAPSLPELC